MTTLKPALLSALLLAASATLSVAHAADPDFVKKAAIGGMTEVAAAKVAQERAASADVKKFAEHMVQDHSKANDQLKQIAQGKGLTVPASPDSEHQKALDKLSMQSGAAFDKAYMNMQLGDHKKTIALFENEAKSGKDAELKAFASDTLPTLKDHLKMAQETDKAVRASAR